MQYDARGLGLAPMLRSHTVKTLDDRVNLIIRLVWDGEAAFNKRHAPEGGLRDPRMRQLGLRVTSQCTARDDMCELNAIHEFVKRNVRYTGDIAMKDLFQSAWRTLQYGGGDCLPTGTRVVRNRGEIVTIDEIRVGDKIMEDGAPTRVLKKWTTGRKPIRRFGLRHGHVDTGLYCSSEHKLFLTDGTEIRAKDVRTEMRLLTPQSQQEPWQVHRYNLAGTSVEGALVKEVEDLAEQECVDITTESGRFYLYDAHVMVHNCDDMSQVAAVLAMENGFSCKFRITSNTGATWDHIICMAGVPKGQNRRWVPLDVTLPRGHAGTHPPMVKHRDFDIDEPR